MKKLILMALAMMCAVASWAAKRAEFAYALDATQTGDEVTFSFKVTGDVTDSRIILTSTSSFPTIVIPLGAVTKGETKSRTYNMSALIGDYTWSVEVTSAAIESTGVAYQDESTTRTTDYPGGIVIITDPEQDSFGYFVVGHGYNHSVDFYNPQVTKTTSGAFAGKFSNQSKNSPIRGDQLRGKAVFADWSDDHSGYWIVDPLNSETAPKKMLQGSRNPSSGLYTDNNSTSIGGSSPAVAFQGSGASTVMYSFVEDLSPANGLFKYTIGTSDEITAAPTYLGIPVSSTTTAALGGGGDIIVYGDGFFATNKNASSNAPTRPAFVYCDNNGAVKFNSSTLTDITSCGTGFAITADGSFAVVHDRAKKKLLFYDVTWSNNTPSFTKSALEIPTPAADTNTADTWSHLRFDPAGNLYAYYDLSGFVIYGFANAAPKATTPAKAANKVSGIPTTRAMAYNLELSMADSDYVLDYYLTADAKNVTFQFYGTTPEDTKTVDLGPQIAGHHTEEISIYEFPISESEDVKDHRNYVWNVDVTSYPTYTFNQLDDNADDTSTGFGGVVPITDPTSPWFGYTVTARGLGGNITLYNPNYTQNQSFKPTCFSGSSQRSPWRGTWYNGYVYFADAFATTSGIYRVDLNNFKTNPTQVFSGERETTYGQFTLPDANIVGGRISGLDFQGTGENTKLWAFESYKEILVRYDLGTDLTAEELNGPFSISKGRTTVIDGNPYFKFTLVEVTAIEDGVFASHRTVDGSGTVTVDGTHVGLIYMKNDGTVVYNSTSTNLLPSYNSGFAINAARNRAAIGQYNDNIVVFSVDWADGVPSFTKIGEIPNTAAGMAQLRFDAAGNLHAYLVGKGYHVYSVPADEAVTTTKYRLAVINNGTVSGAEDMEVAPESDEPARIFNLQGIEMHGELTPGVYIRRTSTKAEKFIVR